MIQKFSQIKTTTLLITFLLSAWCLFIPSQYIFASSSIDPNGQGNTSAELEYDSSTINFKCDECTIEVNSSSVTGYAWGESIGWINFNPANGGVLNTSGVLTGYAFGEASGWINFNPTNGGVSIDENGYWDGSAWSENYGWITFSCPGASSTCVQSLWNTQSGNASTGSLPQNPDEDDNTLFDPETYTDCSGVLCDFWGQDNNDLILRDTEKAPTFDMSNQYHIQNSTTSIDTTNKSFENKNKKINSNTRVLGSDILSKFSNSNLKIIILLFLIASIFFYVYCRFTRHQKLNQKN